MRERCALDNHRPGRPSPRGSWTGAMRDLEAALGLSASCDRGRRRPQHRRARVAPARTPHRTLADVPVWLTSLRVLQGQRCGQMPCALSGSWEYLHSFEYADSIRRFNCGWHLIQSRPHSPGSIRPRANIDHLSDSSSPPPGPWPPRRAMCVLIVRAPTLPPNPGAGTRRGRPSRSDRRKAGGWLLGHLHGRQSLPRTLACGRPLTPSRAGRSTIFAIPGLAAWPLPPRPVPYRCRRIPHPRHRPSQARL